MFKPTGIKCERNNNALSSVLLLDTSNTFIAHTTNVNTPLLAADGDGWCFGFDLVGGWLFGDGRLARLTMMTMMMMMMWVICGAFQQAHM